MDVGCYCVSASRLFGRGLPESVYGQARMGDGVDVRFAATLRFAGDVMATFDCGFDMVARTTWSWSARTARCSPPIPGTAGAPASSGGGPATRWSGSRSSARTPTRWSSTT